MMSEEQPRSEGPPSPLSPHVSSGVPGDFYGTYGAPGGCLQLFAYASGLFGESANQPIFSIFRIPLWWIWPLLPPPFPFYRPFPYRPFFW